MNTYKTTHRASCPNGKLVDTYQITISSHNTIMVEAIIESLATAPNPVFQEDLADYLRQSLGASVVVQGWHYGVEVICERS